MAPYLLILSFVMLWIFLEKKSLNRKAFWVPFISLSLFAGLRSDSVGSDSKNYTRDFVNQLNIDYFEFRSENEIGFQLLHYFILSITKNYFWLFLISAFIVVFFYLFFFKKYSKDYFLSVVVFICFGFYTFFFNGLRQGLAMAIAVMATPFLVEKKIIKFISIISIASIFHRSALILILFYFIVNFKIKIEYKIFSVFFGSLALSGTFVQYIATTNQKYETYAEVSAKSGGYLTLGFYFLIGCIIYIYILKIKNESEFFLKISEFYLYGVVFLIPIAMLGANASGPQRLLFYFVWVLCIIFPVILNRLNSNLIYLCFLIFCVIYFYLTTSIFSNLNPYILNNIFRIF